VPCVGQQDECNRRWLELHNFYSVTEYQLVSNRDILFYNRSNWIFSSRRGGALNICLMVLLSLSVLTSILCFSLLFALLNNRNVAGILVINLRCYLPPNKATIEKAVSECKEKSKQKNSHKRTTTIPLASVPLRKDMLFTDVYSSLVNLHSASFLSLLVCVLMEILFGLFGKVSL